MADKYPDNEKECKEDSGYRKKTLENREWRDLTGRRTGRGISPIRAAIMQMQ